jgi:hypothetical protein
MKPTGPFLEVVSGAAEPDAEVEQLLGAARAWAEPSSENRERVTSALRSALPAFSSTSSLTRAAWPGAAPPPNAPRAAARRAPRAARLARLIIGGALIGALGFWLGHGAGYGEAQREAASRAANRALAPAASSAPGSGLAQGAESTPASELNPSSNTQPAPASMLEPLALAPSSARDEAGVPARARRSAPRAARRADVADRAAKASPPARAGLSFREVLDQLRRAQQQLRNGQATMSLLVLSELDRAAGDVLLEERDATRVLALCAVGQDEAARDVARRLAHDSPRSIYGMRLEASCISEPVQ